MVDLAGSEKVSKSGTTGVRLDEAKTINTSLLALRKVIVALANKIPGQHIPYRESKLTRLLQNSFGGNSHTCLIINCSPSSYNSRETLSSLRFGECSRKIKNKPKENKTRTVEELTKLLNDAKGEIEEQRGIIRQLKQQVNLLKQGTKIENNGNNSNNNGYDIRALLSFFNCVLTKKPMKDPHICSDGHSYEKKAMETYLKTNRISPVTKEKLSSRVMIPNFNLRSQINFFLTTFKADFDDWEFSTLPSEILVFIFSFIGAASITKASKVCKKWSQAANDKILWKDLIVAEYGKTNFSENELSDLRQCYWNLSKDNTKKRGYFAPKSKSGRQGIRLFPSN